MTKIKTTDLKKVSTADLLKSCYDDLETRAQILAKYKIPCAKEREAIYYATQGGMSAEIGRCLTAARELTPGTPEYKAVIAEIKTIGEVQSKLADSHSKDMAVRLGAIAPFGQQIAAAGIEKIGGVIISRGVSSFLTKAPGVPKL